MDEALDIPGLRSPSCSRRALERLHARELSGDEAAQVRAHAEGCPACRETLAALERESARFASEVPFEAFAAAVEAKQRQVRRGRVAGPISLALAAGIALILVWGPMKAVMQAGGGRHLTKGGSVLELFVGGTGAAPRLAQDGEALAPGERIRVGYQAPDKRYVLVLSVDEAGVATPIYPASGESLAVEKGPGTHLMPDSLELTGKGLERLVALFSDEPIEVRAALEAASREFTRAGRLDRMGELPLRAEQSARTLKKPEPK